MTLTLYTLDWVPDFPRGFVRDLRVRWALDHLGQQCLRLRHCATRRVPPCLSGASSSRGTRFGGRP